MPKYISVELLKAIFGDRVPDVFYRTIDSVAVDNLEEVVRCGECVFGGDGMVSDPSQTIFCKRQQSREGHHNREYFCARAAKRPAAKVKPLHPYLKGE